MLLAESHLIGLPFVLVGIVVIVAFRPLADHQGAIDRRVARIVGRGRDTLLTKALLIGTHDSKARRGLHRLSVLLVGVGFVVGGTLAVLGVWNPHG